MEHARALTALSDDALLFRLGELLGQSRRAEAEIVAHIGEVDARRLYAREAAPSMFAYCTEVLYLSEAEAYLRITVARASREHPVLLEMLGDGRLHLSGIAKLAPHLNPGNRDAVLARAAHSSKRAIEELVAELAPRPDAPTLVRKLPQPVQLGPDGAEEVVAAPSTPSVAPPAPSAPPSSILALVPARYRIQLTASAELLAKLERLKALMRASFPTGTSRGSSTTRSARSWPAWKPGASGIRR